MQKTCREHNIVMNRKFLEARLQSKPNYKRIPRSSPRMCSTLLSFDTMLCLGPPSSFIYLSEPLSLDHIKKVLICSVKSHIHSMGYIRIC